MLTQNQWMRSLPSSFCLRCGDWADRVLLTQPPDEPSGPFGAKSVSEIATDGVAPALCSAIHDATGVWIRELPYTPERVWRALKGG